MFFVLVVAAAVSVPVVAAVAVASAENKLHKTFFVDSTKKRSFIKKQQLKFRFDFETRFYFFFLVLRGSPRLTMSLSQKIPLSSQQTVPSQASKMYRLPSSVTTCGNNRFIVTETFHFIGLKCRALQ